MRKSTTAAVGHAGFAVDGNAMSAPRALAALAGLGQATRLEIFRVLMRNEPHGLAAGSIAQTLGCPQNTLSTHIGILARSGLVLGTRSGRSVIYRANAEAMKSLIAYLVRDCCNGHPELCSLQEALGAWDCGQSARGQRPSIR